MENKTPTGIFVPDTYHVKKAQEVFDPIVLEKAKTQPNPLKGQVQRYNGGDPYRNTWAVSYLKGCSAQEYAWYSNPWVWTAIETIVGASVMDQYSIETEDDDVRYVMERFLFNISPGDSFERLLDGIYRDLMINGNWYGRVFYLGGKKSKPCGIERINFKQIVPDVPEDGSNRVKSYSIYPQGANGIAAFKLQAHEVLHFTINKMGDNGTGLSKLTPLDMTIAMERYAQAYQKGFFINGVKAGDIYSPDGPASVEQFERDRTALAHHKDPENAYAPLFLSSPWKLVRGGQELRKDGDFLNLRNWNREEILSVYGVPYSLASTDKVGTLGSNGKQEDRESFLNFVVAPLQKMVFEQFNRKFVVGILNNEQLRLLPPGRPKVRLDDINAAIGMTKVGFTGNEIRSVLNLDLIEGMDEPLFFMGASAIIGIPGDPDSVYLTRMGPISGAPFAVPGTVSEDKDTDPIQNADSYSRLKEKNAHNPAYAATKQQAGNQPSANTLSQSNDAYPGNQARAAQPGTGSGPAQKKNIVTNPVANKNGKIPDNSSVNNPNRRRSGTLPQGKTNDTPKRTKKKVRPNPPGRYKSKVEPNN